MKLFSLLLAVVAVLGVSCERHEFDGPDGTRQLHDHHSGAGHGDDHSKEHGSHDEKKPAH